MTRNVRESDHQELRDLCAGHALGILDPSERTRLEDHLQAGCEECRREIDEYLRTVTGMDALLSEEPAPSGARERFLGGLTEERPAAPASAITTRRSRTTGWLLPAAAMLVVASSLWIAVDSRREVSRLEAELEAFETTTDPLVPIHDLQPTDAAGGGRARATFDPRTGVWRVFAHNMTLPPEPEVYQGWLVIGGEPVSMGTFRPDSGGHGFLTMQADHAEALVRVTLESRSGSGAPTGPVVFDHPVNPSR